VTLVGDAMLRPLLDELGDHDHDTSSLLGFGNGGAPLTAAMRERLHSLLPNVLITDAAGSSETGAQCSRPRGRGGCRWPLHARPDTLVVDETLRHILEPGHPGIGWLAQAGRIPLGYLNDPVKTAATFPVIDGRRYSIPGDRARLLPDGQIELLGRDSVTINSGGEKIFAEEVEGAIAGHPAVVDVVVAGRQSERWGQEVVAIVAVSEGATVTPERSSSMPVRRSPATSSRRRSSSSPPSSGRPRAKRTTDGPRPGRRRMAEVSRASGPRTALLALRRWQESDLAPFAELNADPETMEFFPAPLTRAESDDLVRRIEATIDAEATASGRSNADRCAASSAWSGSRRCAFAVHFAPTVEIGWRLARPYWGRGYATEAATASLAFGFEELGMDEIVSFTSLSNTRSAAVMARIGMHRTHRRTSTTRGSPSVTPSAVTSSGGCAATSGPRRGPRAPAGGRHEMHAADEDGRPRCSWATGDLLRAYHDEEWGVPVHDDRRQFEFLTLEGAQAGLSWLTS